MLDLPVSGGQEKTKAGTLAITAGGKEKIFNNCRSILEVIGKPVLVGEIGLVE
jgi:3-hydroxyisobutyrate dehydrogenase-like beta-hydroxyacid dehydrogenase